MTATIYQTSDLASRRTEVLDAARSGLARVRDKDGTSLVMLPESRLTLLELVSDWAKALLRLEQLLSREGLPDVGDLGDLAWLRSFERSDLEEFVRELRDAVLAASADERGDALLDCVRAWQVTARQLDDPLRRSVLLSPHVPDDFEDAPRPADG
jgi:hypothetical protein